MSASTPVEPVETPDPCPCESGRQYDDCCGPLLSTERLADTAVELMRSRFTAYHYGNAEHLWRTWHPKTRPAEVEVNDGVEWSGLTIHRTEAGGPDDQSGIVEFTATHQQGDLHEVAVFERRAGRWFYVGEQSDEA
ncbi:YchJ family protein [Demetria terragena]|uniref:YchJ family protein n=1 Tax=Demetria terragena TaxID=63959 RepID=UPI0003A83143|nr:YchJ family metal-binding protein [Demetria terragena]